MKKLLLLSGIFCTTFFSAESQVIFSQNFEATTTTMPAGWKQQKTSNNAGWQFNNTYQSNMNGYVAPHTYCAFVDDWDNNPSQLASRDTLYTSSFNCALYSKVFLSLDYLFWIDQGSETASILISTNGGLTWTVAASLANTGSSWSNGNIMDISALAGSQPNVMLAFTYYNGYPGGTYVAVGAGVDNISVYAPQPYDLSVTSQNLPYLMQVGSPYTFSGSIYNYGSTAITSMNMNYSVNGGPVQTQNITGISGFNALSSYNFNLNAIPYTPALAGNYKVRIWADNLNGANVDGNHANDTLYAYFMGVTTVQAKKVMWEEFSNASCNPCMYAVPNVDSVVANNTNTLNSVRYHWYFPGRDFMNQETSGIVNARMNTYYNQYGVPDGQLDGMMTYPGNAGPGTFSSIVVQQAASIGSPFTINISNATFNPITNKFQVAATITSYGTLPAGLTAQTVLTVDSIIYHKNQSQEDPDNSFNFMGGGNPDYLRHGVLHFPTVVEDMMPTFNGSALGAFTPLSTQNLNLTWTKNHPWGIYPKGTNAALGDTTVYDSSTTYHITVFIQSNAGIAASGIAKQYVLQSASIPVTVATGLEEISNGVYIEVYPNPTNSVANVAYKLDQSQEVSIAVYNMLGEKVYSADKGKMGAGQHIESINCQSLQSGVYFVRFTTDNVTTTKKLVIQQ
jgi:hypothetical protein